MAVHLGGGGGFLVSNDGTEVGSAGGDHGGELLLGGGEGSLGLGGLLIIAVDVSLGARLDLGVSVGVWKSEEVEGVNTGERVAFSVEGGWVESESERSKVSTTGISEDMHVVDDVLSGGFEAESHALFGGGSGILEHKVLGLHELVVLFELVEGESVEGLLAGVSLVGDGPLEVFVEVHVDFGVGGNSGGVLSSEGSKGAVESSDLVFHEVGELGHEGSVGVNWVGGVVSLVLSPVRFVKVVVVVVVDFLEVLLHLSSVGSDGFIEEGALLGESLVEVSPLGVSDGGEVSHVPFHSVVELSSEVGGEIGEGLSLGRSEGLSGGSLSGHSISPLGFDEGD